MPNTNPLTDAIYTAAIRQSAYGLHKSGDYVTDGTRHGRIMFTDEDFCRVWWFDGPERSEHCWMGHVVKEQPTLEQRHADARRTPPSYETRKALREATLTVGRKETR